jgi:hypothetical protein
MGGQCSSYMLVIFGYGTGNCEIIDDALVSRVQQMLHRQYGSVILQV